MKHLFAPLLGTRPLAFIVGLMVFGHVASAQTPAREKTSDPALSPPPLAFKPRREMQPSGPSRPTASRWGAYAVETHKRIEKHLAAHRDAFKFKSDLYVELWIEPNGRVRQTRVTGATGNRTVDAMAGPDFPPGLVLPAPDKDMPQPIKVKINADR